jgi:sugar (pentulose or hexulose) kinase
MRRIAVLDIGKTNAKVLLVDLTTGAEAVLAKVPNAVVGGPPYPHHDMELLWAFALDGLKLAAARGVDAVSITTHGAACVLVDRDGGLALPMLDYEHDGPESCAAAYAAVRPGFAETGSPRLPVGLNLGAQLFWQARAFPDAFAKVRHVLMLAQFWSFRLSGVAASEATSLGCHTDLWTPREGRFSPLVARLGWEALFPPLCRAADVLGPVLPEVAAVTGLDPRTPVLCGIHDSNASLVPHLGEAPCGVISTGTWMIVMALGGRPVTLEAARDVLVNVNALGQPVPTARFMAGREVEEIMAGRIVEPSDRDLAAVLSGRVMAMPSQHPGTGPFPGKRFGWIGAEPAGGARMTAASFYAALMGAECLSLVGAEGPVIVEGSFGGNRAFLRMLATATGRVVRGSGAGAGTGLGAALLAGPLAAKGVAAVEVLPETDPLWNGYVAAWREAVARW